MGYALCGDVKEQCIFILWGTGANGKSTFLNTLQTLFGDYACSTATETFMKKTSEQSNDLARLKGMRLVTTTLKWCAKNNERAMCQKNLAIRMQEKGFKRMATNGQRVWLGLVIRNEWRG